MRRVTATIPSYWEDEFEAALAKTGLDGPEFLRTAIYDRVKSINAETPTPEPVAPVSPVFNREADLYMRSAPERLKPLPIRENPQVCIRGQEIGEDHIIEPGELFAWVRFSRDSQPPDWIKNGKLCRPCLEIAKEMWERGDMYF